MGKCRYCGEDAGILSSAHRQCKETYDAAIRDLDAIAIEAINKDSNLALLELRIADLATKGRVPESEVQESLIRGWEEAAMRLLDDLVLSSDEEHRLLEFRDHFHLTQDDLNRRGRYFAVVQCGILRDIMNGKVPDRLSCEGQLPFNLQKSETLVWAFPLVDYYQEKTQTSYVGGSHGLSVRVARGVYYRMGSFRGDPVETSYMLFIDKGWLGITTKHIYFAGDRRSFRVAYGKIVSVRPYSDGIRVYRDGISAKPQAFVVGDGWFIYNLVVNLARLFD